MLAQMFRRAAFVALLSLGALVAPVSGHFGSNAAIVVVADHILPGQQFEVVAIDLTANSIVSFSIRRDETVIPLATATSPDDGHFNITMSVPPDFPGGYAQLYAVAADGTEAMTWVLVGARTGETPQTPPGTAPWYADPSVIVLGVIAVGAVLAVAYVVLRRGLAAPVLPASTVPSRSKRRRRK